jgi:hypothetical protein
LLKTLTLHLTTIFLTFGCHEVGLIPLLWLCNKIITYVKDEGVNLNTFTITLMNIMSCISFILTMSLIYHMLWACDVQMVLLSICY